MGPVGNIAIGLALLSILVDGHYNPYAGYKEACAKNEPITNKKYGCCGTEVYEKNRGKTCCCKQLIDAHTNLCCSGTIQQRPHATSACCGAAVYTAITHHCCDGRVNDRLGDYSACCGQVAFDTRTEFCCRDRVHPKSSGKLCCGKELYDTSFSTCCGDRIHPLHSSHTNSTGLSRHQCCGNELMTEQKDRCCGKKAFNIEEHHCEYGMNGEGKIYEVPAYMKKIKYGFCEGKFYDEREQMCVDGKLKGLPQNFRECVKKLGKDPSEEKYGCCKIVGAVKQALDKSHQNRYIILNNCGYSECGNSLRKNSGTGCCGGTRFYNYHKKESCCAGKVYNQREHYCQNGRYLVKLNAMDSYDKGPKRNHNWCGPPGRLQYRYQDQKCCDPRNNANNDIDSTSHGSISRFYSRDPQQMSIWLESIYEPYVLGIPEKNQGWRYRCCGLKTFDFKKQMCCGHRVLDKKRGRKCCGNQAFSTKEQVCCGTKLYLKTVTTGSVMRCCGNEVLNPGERCLNGIRVIKSEKPPAHHGRWAWNNGRQSDTNKGVAGA